MAREKGMGSLQLEKSGRWTMRVGIKGKAGSSLGKDDFKHLKWFAANLAKEHQFTGIVLYSGDHTLRFGEGFYAVPLAALGA